MQPAACRATCRCLSSGQALPCCSAGAALRALLWFDSFSSSLLQQLNSSSQFCPIWQKNSLADSGSRAFKFSLYFISTPLTQTTGRQVTRLMQTFCPQLASLYWVSHISAQAQTGTERGGGAQMHPTATGSGQSWGFECLADLMLMYSQLNYRLLMFS